MSDVAEFRTPPVVSAGPLGCDDLVVRHSRTCRRAVSRSWRRG